MVDSVTGALLWPEPVVSTKLAQLRAALGSKFVHAFFRVVRVGETHETNDEAYRALYGWKPGNGQAFSNFSDHPRQAFMSKWGWTSAAGAYQAMCAVPGKVTVDTWGDFERWCAREGYRPTFEPADQDLFAVWCINRRGALDDVLAGRVEVAIDKCKLEWASLPGSPHGQPTVALERVLAVWRWWTSDQSPQPQIPPNGEAIAPAPEPTQPKPDAAPPAAAIPAEPDPVDIPISERPSMPAGEAPDWPPQEQPMPVPAIIASAAMSMAPDLLRGLGNTLIEIFSPIAKEKVRKELARHEVGSREADQVFAAVVDAAKTVTGIADPVRATATVTGTPAIVQQVEDDALDTLDRLMPFLDVAEKHARQAHADSEASRATAGTRSQAESYDMTLPLLAGALAFLGVLVVFVCAVALIQLFNTDTIATEVWSLIAGLVGAALGLVTTIYAYRFGTSRSSGTKDLVIGELSRRPRA